LSLGLGGLDELSRIRSIQTPVLAETEAVLPINPRRVKRFLRSAHSTNALPRRNGREERKGNGSAFEKEVVTISS
jgi:hypothetical protein